MLDYAFNKEKCIKKYESLGGGLSKEKVEVMRKKYGSNVLSEKKGKSFGVLRKFVRRFGKQGVLVFFKVEH